jgi:hypothetical protein
MNEETDEKKNKVVVGIFTGYLCKDMCAEGYDEEYMRIQKEKFGYDPDNMSGQKFLYTPKFMVRLDTRDDHESMGPGDLTLAIAGSTEGIEEHVRGFMGAGLIVARYSVFYGGPSKYTGNYPEESGYSLDIPKKVSTAKALITDDCVLEAILARDEKAVVEAISELNKKLEQPILVTSYLPKALSEVKR